MFWKQYRYVLDSDEKEAFIGFDITAGGVTKCILVFNNLDKYDFFKKLVAQIYNGAMVL